MKTVILAGGRGTRLSEETAVRPKPMVEVGGYPLLWHIMKLYSGGGFRDFVLALGYKGEIIKNYFVNYYLTCGDLRIRVRTGAIETIERQREDWTVSAVETGASVETGGRLRRLTEWLDGETFMMTYGDGVGDIDLRALVSFHRNHGKLATVTAVRPPARFGHLQIEGDEVTNFAEKSQLDEGWVNGGFFVLEPQVLAYIDGDATVFEREPLDQLSREGQLMAYKHQGFWQCMDTLRDVRFLEELWQSGKAPWKTWND
jgi:glucose-1-phosphate cytidylyltransferase